ncbi:MAG: hypothetical protein K1X53_08355 [Candidatus Sumerlaeaceae bacterium]|nr:hypothetical protein [Candidatus Sumerlaeaceae bacterium]
MSVRTIAWGLIIALVILLFFLEASGPLAVLIFVSMVLCIITPEWERSSRKNWEWQHYEPSHGRSRNWFRHLLIYEAGCISVALLLVVFFRILEFLAAPENQAYWHQRAINGIVGPIGGALAVLAVGCVAKIVIVTLERTSRRGLQDSDRSAPRNDPKA